MPTLQTTLSMRRLALVLACTPVVLALTGCPIEPLNPRTPKVSAAATAPTMPAAQLARPAQDADEVAAREEAARAQKVQQLIDRAEADYSAGVANYNGNRLDAARLDFDAAVDTMLTSGMDLKHDPQLSDEFDHLLAAINSLEMTALKQGNGFSPQVDQSPIDAATDVTFPPDPALVTKVNAELKTTTSDFPLLVNDYVAGWIRAFSDSPSGHAHLKASLERAGKYKEMIQRILREQGVPQDLIYQAVAESGFQPQALNRRSGAGGMWQFMPFGNYGLEHNGYFDERFDPEKSTIAYAKYMKSLYNQFGDWYLAMAAYDWGPGNVQRVVARTGYADFWELYRRNVLPGETKNYVPAIIAAIIMAKNPKQYGLTDLVPDAPVLSDTVTTDYAIDLRLVADLTDSTVAELVTLNPALLRLSTPNGIAYDLHLPPGTKQDYLDRVKEIPEENRASWRFHIVKAGETLDQIASDLHSRATEIASVNDLTASQPVEAGDELVVPVAASSSSVGEERYRLRRGDTLVTVADRFGVTVEQLRAWNHLRSSRVEPGHSIYVAEPVRLAPGMRAVRSHHGRRKTSEHRSTRSRTRSSHAGARAATTHRSTKPKTHRKTH